MNLIVKKKNILLEILCLPLALTLLACGGTGSNSSSGDIPPDPIDVSTGNDVADPVSTKSGETHFFGENGNLWKPKAEEGSSTAGLLVVLLAPEHTGRFDSCEVKKRDGSVAQLDCNDRVPWSHTPFSCVANGGREHWRANFTCDQAAEVKVVCRNSVEEVTFRARGAAISAVCSRHG